MRLTLLLLFILIWSGSTAAALWTITYPRPLSEADLRDEYPRALLTLALEKTGVKYELKPSERILLQGKALRQLRENREVNVVWSMTDSQREKDLLPIRIPIAKGLIGLRIFLINRQRSGTFRSVDSARELVGLAPIQGEEWPDTKILQANGFNVITVPDYPEAMELLASNRGDFFPRSVIEVNNELEEAGRDPDIVLEPRLAIHYPSAMYFFVNRGNPTLARLIETGLRRALDDGSFDALFMSTHEEILNSLNLPQRQIFTMENPLMPPQTPLGDSKLWLKVSDLSENE
ncbi:transporter substrate-binding domain-containing protein [Alteromonas sp. ASW11-19]|uniref:Transporter substrate-binding domain-containing protein n=1 Tax=Alteromonas salexigens TaxID=2982530 RepID=A0ABT2VQK5_9ALTE|nr:transporter substrate-binding domain-containing protein [Alteromonas salexigens]MCU7555152.1 transporter substrate-binding domain-containing protein [Alteromonas salexigens]